MRKGRSQRKTRNSQSAQRLSSIPPPVALPSNSRLEVVVGVAEPHADPARVASEVASNLERLAEPTVQVVSQAALLKRVETERHDLVSESGAVQDVISDPFAHALTEDTPAPPKVAPISAREQSVPPMGDLVVEPVAERFFSEGDIAEAHGDHEDEWHRAPAADARKTLPHVVERRERFARYVKWAVGGAAAVCAIALVRTLVMPLAESKRPMSEASAAFEMAANGSHAAQEPKADTPAAREPNTHEVNAEVATNEQKAPEVTGALPVATSLPQPEEAIQGASANEKSGNVEERKAAPSANAPTPDVAATKVDDPKPKADLTASQEKEDARRNLERGKLAAAIEAGERSVALDPTDGEAWLLLGASYQEKGKTADARRCYTSCIKEGKRGPLGECRAMLR